MKKLGNPGAAAVAALAAIILFLPSLLHGQDRPWESRPGQPPPGPPAGAVSASGIARAAPESPDGAPPQPAVPGLPEEAPATIFDTRLGDEDVELALDGYWDASVRSSIGLAFLPGQGLTYPFVFPGFSDGLVFEQKPDLLISLWLRQRYFLETSIGEDYRMNSYLLGYRGKEGELVQSVKAGNRDIEISPFPYMDFPGSARKTPGISAVFQTPRSRHEFLFRYDPSLPQKKTFMGRNEVRELRIDPASPVRGRHFVLPDPGADFLELFIEDRDGGVPGDGGRRYRRATSHDYSYSPGDGVLSLTRGSPGRVLVYYEKNGDPVGSAGLGSGALPAYTPGPPIEIDDAGSPVDFSWGMGSYMGRNMTDWLRTSIAGRQALLLYDPGAFNPFEVHGVYPLSGFSPSAGTSPRLVRQGSDAAYSPASALSLAFSAEGTEVRVLGETVPDRSMTSRFPFARDEPRLYGPDRLSDGGGPDFEILVQSYTPGEGYRLSSDVIPGSVTVLRNGRREDAFSVDYATGLLTFPFEPAASDRIEIFYRTYSGEGEGGDILFGSGSTVELRKDLQLKVATGLRWNVLKGSYSAEAGDHEGFLGASARLAYNGEKLRAAADGAVMYMNPDTSGLLRLMGMEKHEMELEMSKYNMFPSSIPAPGSPYADGMTGANRGRLFFKNYEKTDLLGSVTLNSYASSPTDSFPYETGSFPGPYIASAASEGAGEVMVMDFAMDSGAGEEWVGAQLNLSSGWAGSLDLSRITSIRFAYKAADLAGGTVTLRLQAGSLDEDLDGDGVLDEETGASSRGYPFNHGGMTLLVGAGQKGLGNERRDSEDANGNRVLDRENPGLVFADDVAPLSAPGGWETGLVKIPASERNRLAATRSLRLILRRTGGSPAGRVLVGKFVFEGASAAARAEGAGSLSLREIPEVLGDIAPDQGTLAQAFGDVLDTFHSRDGAQHVLEARWEDAPPAPGAAWEIRSFTTPVPAGSYRTLNLFLRVARLDSESPPGPVTQDQVLLLSYTDAQGRGLRRLEIPLTSATADNVWNRLSVDLPGGRARLGSQALAPLLVDADHGELVRFSLSMENRGGGAGKGVLYLDEVHMTDPRDGLGFAGSLDLSFRAPGTVLSLGGAPLVSNLEVSQTLNARTSRFQTRKDADTDPGKLSSSTAASADILETLGIRGEFAFSRLEDRILYEGGHELRFPARDGPLVLTEKFKRDFGSPSPAMSRENRVRLALLPGLSLGAGAGSVLSAGNLGQTWDGSAGYESPDFFSLKMNGGLENNADGYVLENEGYGESWISAYRLLEPWTKGTGGLRRGRYRLDSSLTGESLGLILGLEFGYHNSARQDLRQRNDAEISLELPLRIRRGPHDPGKRLSLWYSRKSSMLREVPAGGSFDTDLRTYGDALADHRYFWTSPPFAEILAPLEASPFGGDTLRDARGEYSSRTGLRFSRPLGSRVTDLLIPSRAEAEAGKTLARGGEVLSASNAWSLSVTNYAINLFGRQGAHPVFPWYESDEFQLQNSLTLATREGDPDRDWSFTTHQLVTLLGRGGENLVVDHALTVEDRDSRTYRGTGSVKYLWRSPMLRDFGLGPLRAAKEGGAHYRHAEKADLSYSWLEGLKGYLVLGHETALTFRGSSFIKAELNLGLGFEKDYSGLPPGYRILLGLGGGISAHFLF